MTASRTPEPSFLPSVEDYQRRAADQGLGFEPHRYAAAVVAHTGMRAALLRLREVPLSFLDPTEPASALSWIENGGISA